MGGRTVVRKPLLVCGILSSLLYVGADVLAALRYEDYHSFTSQAISELTAVGAPTRPLVGPLFIAYDVLLMAFGVAVWKSPGRKGALHLVGGSLIGIALVGLFWPPMQLRGTGDVSGDVPHIVFAGLIVALILLAVGFGSALLGRRFRLYSFVTLLVLLTSGALTGLAGPRLAVGQPTPWLGIAERINVGAYLLWVIVLGVMLLRSETARPAGSADNEGSTIAHWGTGHPGVTGTIAARQDGISSPQSSITSRSARRGVRWRGIPGLAE